MRLETARDLFITYKREGSPYQRGLAPNTLRAYRWHLQQFIDWMAVATGSHSALKFNAQRAREYLDHRSSRRDLSLHTLNLDSTVLREFAAWGAKHRYWQREDVEDIPRIDKPKTLPRPYHAAERDRLMTVALGPADRVLRALLYYAGLRESEAIGLRLRDLAPPSTLPTGETIPGRLHVWGKGSKERVVEIHAALWHELEAYLKSLPPKTPLDRHLLAKRDGEPWSAFMVQARVRKWGRRAEVERPKAHRFRHTFATDVLDASPGEIRTLQALLGHASLATTEIYTKVSDKRKAAAVGRLPDFTPAPATIRADFARPVADAPEAPRNPAPDHEGA
jgi:site-specific recombinase XerC